MAVSRHAVEHQQAVIMQLWVSYIKNFSYCGSLSTEILNGGLDMHNDVNSTEEQKKAQNSVSMFGNKHLLTRT